MKNLGTEEQKRRDMKKEKLEEKKRKERTEKTQEKVGIQNKLKFT